MPITTPNSAHHNAQQCPSQRRPPWRRRYPYLWCHPGALHALVQRVRLVDHEDLALADLEQRRRLLFAAAHRGRDQFTNLSIRSGMRGEAHRARGPLVRRRFRGRARFSHHAISKSDHKELE